MKKPKPDSLAILKILAIHRVDFIVVGGISGVLQGAPIATFDLDIVHSAVLPILRRTLEEKKK